MEQSRILLMIGIGAAVIGLGLLLWYLAAHPPKVPGTGISTATSTLPVPTKTESGSLTEHAAYYDIEATYPKTTALAQTAGAAADEKAVTIIKTFEENQIDAFKENGNFANLSHDDVQMMGLDQRKYSLTISYESRTGPHTISYLITLTQDTGGAHPNTYFRTFTFDSSTGEGLQLGDLFMPSANYVDRLSKISRGQLPDVIAASSGIGSSQVNEEMIAQGTTPDADNFQNWYLDGQQLVIIFPSYQVAPYAAGPQTLHLPLSSLKDILKPRYQ